MWEHITNLFAFQHTLHPASHILCCRSMNMNHQNYSNLHSLLCKHPELHTHPHLHQGEKYQVGTQKGGIIQVKPQKGRIPYQCIACPLFLHIHPCTPCTQNQKNQCSLYKPCGTLIKSKDSLQNSFLSGRDLIQQSGPSYDEEITFASIVAFQVLTISVTRANRIIQTLIYIWKYKVASQLPLIKFDKKPLQLWACISKSYMMSNLIWNLS